MMKTLLAGIAAGTAMAFVTDADAAVRHHKHRTAVYHEGQPAGFAGPREMGGHDGYPTAFRLPAHPLIWDCVHVVFPQCGRGYDNLNDGSFK